MELLKSVKVEGESIGSCLRDLAATTLPKEFTQEASVSWILGWQRRSFGAEGQWSGDYMDEFDDPAWAVGSLICRDVMAQLRPLVSFYFASLIHIGRMQVVSDYALERIGRLEDAQNMATSAASLSKALGSPDAIDSSSAELLRRACNVARSAQQEQRQLSQWWFERWRQEVEPLRQSISSLEEEWITLQHNGRKERSEHYRTKEFLRVLLKFSGLASRFGLLRQEMERAGVRFRDEPGQGAAGRSITPLRGPLGPILLAALVGSQDREFWHFEWRHLFHEFLAHEYHAPGIEQLRLKYAGQDPFKQYSAGGSPADRQLIALIQENLLWNNRESPWLDAWRRSLPSAFHPYRDRDWIERSNLSKDAAEEWIEHADGYIKHTIIHKRPAPGEDWSRFIQQWFDEFVFNVSTSVHDWNQQQKDADRRHSADRVAELFGGIVELLNERGYNLKRPVLASIQRHLGDAEGGETDEGSAIV